MILTDSNDTIFAIFLLEYFLVENNKLKLKNVLALNIVEGQFKVFIFVCMPEDLF